MRRSVLVSLSVFLVGCPSEPSPSVDAQPPAPSTQAPTARYLALGDSYTIGEAVEPTERWPVQLAQLLRDDGVAVAEPEIVARTGWTTGELLAGIERAQPQGPYALVTLLIGVNNQFRGLDPEAYRRELRTLLERAIAFADGQPSRVLVLSTPDWGATPFGKSADPAKVAAEIDRFNRIEAEEARALGLVVIDVTPISRRAPAEPNLIARDDLHPSGRMYAEWAQLALPHAKAALAN